MSPLPPNSWMSAFFSLSPTSSFPSFSSPPFFLSIKKQNKTNKKLYWGIIHTLHHSPLKWMLAGLPLAVCVSLASSDTSSLTNVCHCAGCWCCHRPCLWSLWFHGGFRWEAGDMLWWRQPGMPCTQAGTTRGLLVPGMLSSSSWPQIHPSEFYWITSNSHLGGGSSDEVEGSACLWASQNRHGVEQWIPPLWKCFK